MASAHKLELTYFDFHGGRGEPVRLALAIGDIDFKDNRVSFAQWGALKPETPFGGMPLLEVDDRTLTQCNGILRFVGKLANLYPEDPWQAALCDEVMEAMEDVSHAISPTFFMTDEDERKAAREKLADGIISRYLRTYNAMLGERGDYFADGRLTVADLKIFVWVRHMRSGRLDHVATDLVDRLAPNLVGHFERVNQHPGVVAYYERVGGY